MLQKNEIHHINSTSHCKNKTKTTHGKQNKKTNKKVYNFEKIKNKKIHKMASHTHTH